MHVPVAAQDTTRVRPDSTRARLDTTRTARDSAGADSAAIAAREAADRKLIAAARARADTLKAPLAHAELPIAADVAPPFDYDRASLAASGALNIGELLDRVPGVTVFRSGWIASPHVAATMGEMGTVRVFYDGVEIDPLDPRVAGIMDLTTMDLWQQEGARIERGADETRIYLRSWRSRSVTPETRVDIATGDLETNGYRGYFARRFARGEALQVGAYQFSSRDVRNGGDVDQLSLFSRLGWAKGGWSVDGSWWQLGRTRAAQEADAPFTNLAKLDSRNRVLYARIGFRDPDRPGFWAQAIASSQKFLKQGDSAQIVIDSIPGPGGGGPGGSKDAPDTLRLSTDTSVTSPQYIAALGYNVGPMRMSSTTRARSLNGVTHVSETLRGGIDTRRLSISVFAEKTNPDGKLRTELMGRVMPFKFLSLGGAVSRHQPDASSELPTSLAFRGELGLRLGRVWLTGGIMARDSAALAALRVFDTAYVSVVQGQTTGYFGTINGRVWKDVGLSVFGVRYAAASAYRPQYQVRSEVYLDTTWPSRFPSGHLNIKFAVTHEYRTEALFYVQGKQGLEALESSQYRNLGLLLEIRLLQATLTYQYRNFLGEQYAQVPGFEMPRPVNFYGVRWYFFN